jgi:hypothetical protein
MVGGFKVSFRAHTCDEASEGHIKPTLLERDGEVSRIPEPQSLAFTVMIAALNATRLSEDKCLAVAIDVFPIPLSKEAIIRALQQGREKRVAIDNQILDLVETVTKNPDGSLRDPREFLIVYEDDAKTVLVFVAWVTAMGKLLCQTAYGRLCLKNAAHDDTYDMTTFGLTLTGMAVFDSNRLSRSLVLAWTVKKDATSQSYLQRFVQGFVETLVPGGLAHKQQVRTQLCLCVCVCLPSSTVLYSVMCCPDKTYSVLCCPDKTTRQKPYRHALNATRSTKH